MTASGDSGASPSRSQPLGAILVVTTEPIGTAMAGPAIRAVELGRVLAAEHDVVVASTASCEFSSEGPLRLGRVDRAGLRALASSSDVVIVSGDVLAAHRWLADTGAAVVVDLYDPFHLEQLEQARDLGPAGRQAVVFGCIDALNTQLALGDLFLCASTRQRDLWLGHLAACGRINPTTYDADPSLESLVRVVPFGVPEQPPARAAQPVLRGVVDGIGPDDDVLLWGGGIYNWFDPETLIEAIDVLRHDRPNLRLVFLGSQHPNPAVATMRAAAAARELSKERGLTGVHVFFSDMFSSGWVPYAQRGRYLAEATIGITTHHEHIETAFSFRTRMLDYFWAGLPVVTTRGDALADLVESAGAGRAVAAGDVAGLVAAIDALLGDRGRLAAAGGASAALADRYRWSAVAAPLLAFCRAPQRAPDRADPQLRREIERRALPRAPGFGVRLGGVRQRAARDGWVTTVRRGVGRRLERG